MKRMHVHVAVESIDNAVAFYSTLFAEQPSVVKPDYAKWMLDDPRVNFAISTRGKQPGLDHLGIQVESTDDGHSVERGARVAKEKVCCEPQIIPPSQSAANCCTG